MINVSRKGIETYARVVDGTMGICPAGQMISKASLLLFSRCDGMIAMVLVCQSIERFGSSLALITSAVSHMGPEVGGIETWGGGWGRSGSDTWRRSGGGGSGFCRTQ